MKKLTIETVGLGKTYQIGFFKKVTVQALQGLTLSIPENTVFGLLGPNGAGKSTTIKLLLNLIRPSSGSCQLFGMHPGLAAARRDVGFLPENPAPYEYLTGRELVTLAAQLSDVPSSEIKSRVSEVIERVEMTQASTLQIRRYSKGMVQRISVAQALVNRPKLLILDEPTSGLDVLGRKLIRDIIVAERQRGTTILFCSHIIPDVEELCDRVAVLIGGKLVKEGSVSELLSTQRSQMEATIEGLDEAAITAFAPPLVSKELVGTRWRLRFDDQHTSAVLQAALGAGGKVMQLQPLRFTLEQLFLEELKNSRRKVGSDLS